MKITALLVQAAIPRGRGCGGAAGGLQAAALPTLKCVRMARWMRPSVSGSTLAVASSATSSRGLRSSARATHTSCRCPTLKLPPPSATGADRPPAGSQRDIGESWGA